jgi:hypothetical protein
MSKCFLAISVKSKSIWFWVGLSIFTFFENAVSYVLQVIGNIIQASSVSPVNGCLGWFQSGLRLPFAGAPTSRQCKALCSIKAFSAVFVNLNYILFQSARKIEALSRKGLCLKFYELNISQHLLDFYIY